jgi:hypothetical protein
MRRTLQADRATDRIVNDEAVLNGTYTLMADVSEFQSDIIDSVYLIWSQAIIIRAAFGAAHDDRAWYGGQRRAALHAGGAKFIGIYQYLVAGQDGATQARAFARLVGALQPGEVLIADFEEGQKAMLTAWYNEMLALGYPNQYLWTYTGLNFGTLHDVLPVQWIAAYQGIEPSSPHILWQFTDNLSIPGVGTTDCSVYHGTIDQLAGLAYQPSRPTSNWTFDVVQNLNVVGIGPSSVKVSFGAPSGFLGTPPTPAPGVAGYEMAMSPGASLSYNVDSYPRWLDKGANPEQWQVGSLQASKQYTLGIRAALHDRSHSGPWAKATFWTKSS